MSTPYYIEHEGRVYMVMHCARAVAWKRKLMCHFEGDPPYVPVAVRVTPAHFVRFARSRSADGHNIEYLMVLWDGRRRPLPIMRTTRPKDFYTEAAAATVALLHGVTRGRTS